MRGKFGKWGQANNGSLIFADLGPTNTGKTHRALQRMLELKRGIIGLPLRLLAREVYDKLVTQTAVRDVALLTGEERTIPSYSTRTYEHKRAPSDERMGYKAAHIPRFYTRLKAILRGGRLAILI